MIQFKYTNKDGKFDYDWGQVVPGETIASCCGAQFEYGDGYSLDSFGRGIVVREKHVNPIPNTHVDVIQTKNGPLSFILNPV